ncbi:MAG: NAD(P)-binding domain-containing protein [Flavipsychrobacter sp.]
MKIAIIGTGNVGSALAQKWHDAGHTIHLGVRDINQFKGIELLKNKNITAHNVQEAVALSEVILLSVPASKVIDIARNLGNTKEKVIIDAMNNINKQLKGFNNTTDAILLNTNCQNVVKCFNTTGYNNMIDTKYKTTMIDAFVAGDSEYGKKIATQLAKDANFGQCYDIGGNIFFDLMEQFAFFWINLAINQKMGRDIAFKLLNR